MSETVQIRQVSSLPVIDLQGKITLGETSTKVREAIDGLIAQGQSRILLNMAAVSYVDSAGLGAIASCHVKSHNAGGSVSLCQVSPRVAELLQLTRLNEKLKIYSDEASGLKALLSQGDSPQRVGSSPAPVSSS